jgi:DNA-binding beta-propeller fold protein YncE
MATLDPTTQPGFVPSNAAAQDMREPQPATNPLTSFMAKAYSLNWEVAFYLVVLVIAVLTRFVGLGDRVMSHDESLHVKYSHELWRDGNFAHTPLMHGPVLFHMTALSYFLFGDSDFSGRLYPAILGIIMVLMPKLLFQRWLGKFGAMMTTLLILISPMLLYHHRYIREDTPALFFTILMVYSIFAYLDGVKPRQTWHLVLFSGATLLNLASKETAFMYIGVFGFILTLLVLIQVVQGWKQRAIGPAVWWAVIGLVAVPVAAIVSTLIAHRLLGGMFVQASVTSMATDLVGKVVLTLLIGLPLTAILAAGMMLVIRVLWGIFHFRGSKLLGWVGNEGHSLIKMIMAGMIIGTTFALLMTIILSIIKPETIQRAGELWAAYDEQKAVLQEGQPEPVLPSEPRPETMQVRLAVWTGFAVLTLVGAILLTAVGRFSRLPSLPWRDILIVILVAAVWGTAMIIFEERTRNVPNVSSENRPAVTEYDGAFVAGSWVFCVSGMIGMAFLRWRTRFFQQMRRYPAFDLAIVLGSLVLPWLAAIPLFLAHFQMDVSSYPPETIQAMFIGTVPFVGLASVIGLCWNPGVWLLCAGTFYSLFAFFFTTIFTNVQGVATGLVGSLGYWMAQQGVKRGSQPQYYYLLIQLPIYEYLMVIGGSFAGILGLSHLWRWRADRAEEKLKEKHEAATLGFQPDMATGAGSMENASYATNDAPTVMSVINQTAAVELPPDPLAATPNEAAPETLADVLHAEERPETLADVLAAEGVPTSDDPDLPPDFNEEAIPAAERLTSLPFMAFVGYWAVLIIMALTAAGEKMPWLTTHLTLPLCFATGWYLGHVMERVNWKEFLRASWGLIFLVPLLIIGVGNVFSPALFGRGVFGGLQRDQLLTTFTWLGAILLTGTVGYAVWRVVRNVGWQQSVRVGVLGLFALLGVLTARTAWNSAYLNYDLATEYMVYAHGAPANKTIINYIEDISRRTTDGMNIKVAYDDQMSWPGSWYFRNFPNARFLGNAQGANDLDQYIAIAVGTENSATVEPQLAENYQKFDLIRLWWPMQDYFDLNLARVDNALGDSQMRQALWDIWLDRNYRTFGEATGDPNRFDISRWPVVDRMVFYVRKDVASQIWDFGVGAQVSSVLPSDAFANLRCDTCGANFIYDTAAAGMNYPRGVAVDAKGNVYVADSRNGRILIFNTAGQLSNQISTKLTPDPNIPPGPGNFAEPWGVDVDAQGNIYVADTWYHRVLVFGSDGQLIREWGLYEQSSPTVPGMTTGFYGPRDIKLDAQGNVYVADTGNKRVRVYDREGLFLRDIGIGAAASNMKEPVGIAIDNELQEIYVASTWSKKIEVYSLMGEFKREWAIRAWAATTETQDTGNRPFLALDKTGRYLFVTDPDVARVLVYESQSGTPALQFGRLGSVPFTNSQFSVLGGITVNRGTGEFYMVDAGSGRILRFDAGSLPGLTAVQNPIPVFQPTSIQATPLTEGLPGLLGTAEATTDPVAEATAEVITEATPEATLPR